MLQLLLLRIWIWVRRARDSDTEPNASDSSRMEYLAYTYPRSCADGDIGFESQKTLPTKKTHIDLGLGLPPALCFHKASILGRA
jgi:hypothetical protein